LFYNRFGEINLQRYALSLKVERWEFELL